jgi:tetratricopeptide (TPR) repeat protein
MTDDAASVYLQRGLAFEEQGDIVAAEREYRLADDTGSAAGALNLGSLLKRRGDHAGAVAAYRRSEERGDPRASCNLAVVLEELGDIDGAKAAYRRADERGFPGGAYGLGQLLYAEGNIDGSIAANRRADELGDADGAYNLGILLKQCGDLTGAEAAFGRADQRGHTGGTVAFGKLLRDRGDHEGAELALRRAEEQGDPEGAFELGALAYDRQDIDGAVAAFERAASLGKDGAAELAGKLREQSSLPPQPSATNMTEGSTNADLESPVKHAHLYGAACRDVLNATNAVLEIANRAVGARNMANNPSQHEISRKNFRQMAEREEQEFVPPYKAFLIACTSARDAAASFRAAAASYDPELLLLSAIDDDAYGQAGAAIHILRTNFGPTPSAFLEGIEAANAAIRADIFAYGEDGFLGHVYLPPPPVAAAERVCPWCAETIKAAAVVCRFCGRDVEPSRDV